MITTIILTGKPGSGKGTQAKRLAEERGWVYFSTGERFKVLREAEGPLGEQVRAVYDSGALMPDWFATYLFQEAMLALTPDQGIVIDGYPRSRVQAETFIEITSWLNRPYRVIDLNVPNEEVTARMLKRATEEHRPDSATEEQIRARLATYEEYTAPVLDFFREHDAFTSLDGTGTPDEVAARINETIA